VSSINITQLASEQIEPGARLLGRAFVTNPLHVAVFGAGNLAANDAFFRVGLAAMKGPKLMAMEGSQLVGVIHWVASPACQYSPGEKLRMMPGMARNVGLRPALRVAAWLSHWARLDPAGPHIHLGPIGVDPEVQGRQIGRQLMERYCQAQDQAGLGGYLETDRPENVDFYRRFDFEVTATRPVLDVPNYFMCRRARRA
jgi:ribosomal protein S18 acetylase RimI-like enzyme